MPAQQKPVKYSEPANSGEEDSAILKRATQIVHLLEGDKIDYVRAHATNLIQVEKFTQQMWQSTISQQVEKVQELHDLNLKMLKNLVKTNKVLLVGENDKARRDALKHQIEEIQNIINIGDAVFSKKN